MLEDGDERTDAGQRDARGCGAGCWKVTGNAGGAASRMPEEPWDGVQGGATVHDPGGYGAGCRKVTGNAIGAAGGMLEEPQDEA